MSHIKWKDTSIEVLLRKTLWHKGIRCRKNYKKLSGPPDIAITKYKIVIFCNSELFHGYNWRLKNKSWDAAGNIGSKKLNAIWPAAGKMISS